MDTTPYYKKLNDISKDHELARKKLDESDMPLEQKKAMRKHFATVANAAINMVYDDFRRDLIEDRGLTNNPKVKMLYDKAWEMGHSSGFSDIIYYFDEMSELIK
jgi:hypothetical protein